MDLGIKGRTVLVTGAAKGIGRAIATALAKEGAHVALHYQTSEEEAQETKEMIWNSGGQVTLVKGDLASLEDVQHMKDTIESELGFVHSIVNNAGYAQYKPFFKYSPNEWRREVDVCLYGVVHLAHVFIPDMIEQKGGKLINIIGDSARTGDRNLIISAAARSGAVSFLKSLAQEVGRHQIQCNTVSLGLTDQGQSYEAATLDKILKQYPLKRLGTPDDVKGAVLFLLSSLSDWITGQVLSVNGGQSMMD
ncbi:short-chain dehydrogenase/reductase SDR [Bacillus sp. OxB-1]|uniref:SDR family NAD(P)-dependent oxidoreductase n=1 Tax=Bacillus sp. (strain OxB-1) TaxID=98228 RepID=UPI000581C62D|nr:SDR family oxidoreductase [Bacillus sp. OxB-1]BAQ09637.1 short-chain dehydrogenase/reductase SDR [Bacillus sp. OxB-1]